MPPDCAFLKGSPFILWDLGSDLWCPRVPIDAPSPLANLCGLGVHPIEDVLLKLCQVCTISSKFTRLKRDYLRWFKWIEMQPHLPEGITLRDPLLYPDDALAEQCRRRVWSLLTLVGLRVAIPHPAYLECLEVDYASFTSFLWLRRQDAHGDHFVDSRGHHFKVSLPSNLLTSDKLFAEWVRYTRTVTRVVSGSISRIQLTRI